MLYVFIRTDPDGKVMSASAECGPGGTVGVGDVLVGVTDVVDAVVGATVVDDDGSAAWREHATTASTVIAMSNCPIWRFMNRSFVRLVCGS
ncbi:hypothetical protein AAHS21_15695 [Mycobacterium sp. 050272]|uniref:hypothetical protein n=1 Tax=Mycobacterium sp. 050272 TaxID=3142488 RepID=UPI003187D535